MGIEVTDEGGVFEDSPYCLGCLGYRWRVFLVTRPATTGVIFAAEVMAIFWVVGGIIDFILGDRPAGDLWGLRLTFAIISFIAGLYILGSPILGTMMSSISHISSSRSLRVDLRYL